jgi:hypothetical protein
MERNAKMPRRKPIQWDEPVEGSESYIEPPATTRSGRDAQMVDLAYRCVERRMRDGTASSQETTHFLKLATVKEQREREKLEAEIKLANAKIASLESQSASATLYADAIEAFSIYSGKKNSDER